MFSHTRMNTHTHTCKHHLLSVSLKANFFFQFFKNVYIYLLAVLLFITCERAFSLVAAIVDYSLDVVLRRLIVVTSLVA